MAGIYPWSYAQYVELAALTRPSWWSAPDLCNENCLVRGREAVAHRIKVTVTLLEGTLRVVYAWQIELAKTCSADVVANMLQPPTPIIQGFTISEYLACLDLVMEVWERWRPWLAAPSLIGLGSVCRRSTSHPEHGLYGILRGLDGRLPEGSKLHLFGVKGTSLNEVRKLPWVSSVDSMAWDFTSRVAARKEQRSNTMEHRSAEMTRWMSAAAKRLTTQPGGQRELSLFA